MISDAKRLPGRPAREDLDAEIPRVRVTTADRRFLVGLGRGHVTDGVRAAIRIARVELEKTIPGSVAGLED